MELDFVISKRKSVRDFSSTRIPYELIIKAIGAGFKAPCYNHLRQWDFILIKDEETRIKLTKTEPMIENINEELIDKFKNHDSFAKEMYLEAIPKQKRMILNAPELVVITFKPKTLIKDAQRVYDLNCLASVWCCIENFLLALTQENIFGVTFIPKNTKAIMNILNVPDGNEVAAIIPFGYKKDDTKEIKQKEIKIEDHIHKEKW